MVLNSQDARGFESRVVAYYARAETYLIELIADAIRRTGDAPNWAESLLVDVRRMRGAVEGMNTAVWEKTPGEMMQAVDQAYARGVIHGRADVQDAVPTPPPVQPINHAAVVSIASEGARSLFPVHQHLYRRVDDAVRAIINEASGLTVVGAKTPQEAMRQALNGMAKRGMGFYRDPSGRKWALDAYAEMATRTITTNALRAGYTDSLVDAGFDLVVVSSHKNPAPQCAPFERKVLSLTGKYSAGTHRVGDRIVNVKATMRDAEASGLHHPNAILGGKQSIDTLAGAIGASKATYIGPALTIRTAKGNQATVSPKHPVLTRRGWVTAESLRVGDYVFNTGENERSKTTIAVHPNFDNVPSTVEDEFIALEKRGIQSLVPASGLNFDDDRKFIKGEVNVVVTDDCLLPVPDAQIIKETGEVRFVFSDVQSASRTGNSSFPLDYSRVGSTVGRTLSDSDSIFCESPAQRRIGDSEVVSEVLTAVSGVVHADEVVDIDMFTFEGHAYDFQTVDGVYSVGSILLHNCRHTTSLYQPGVTPKQPPEPDTGHEGYKATQKQRYLERQIRASKRLEAAAVTEEDAKKARDRIRNYQAKLRAHIDEHNLPRRPHREALRMPLD